MHDYRTYLDQRGHEDLAERRDQAGQLLLAALADQCSPGRRRGAEHGQRRDWLRLDHTDPQTGATRPGPRPDQPTLDDLLNLRGETSGPGDNDAPDENHEPQD